MFFNKCRATLLVVLAAGVVGVAGLSTRSLLAQAPDGKVIVAAGAPAPGQDKILDAREDRSAKMQKLLKDRESAAQTEFRAQNEQFIAGRGTLDILLATSGRLLRAELELATTRQKRVAAREAEVERIGKILEINTARYNAGRASIADLAQTRYFHLDAQIELEREKTR
jgi:outer membrane protein TolC